MNVTEKDHNYKCDVIIPVYNAPRWVKLCVYSLFCNTPLDKIGKVYLLDDNSDPLTEDCLRNLQKKYPKHIEIFRNERNLGFVKTVNRGLVISKADYVLLLNTDCLVAKNTIPKLISHMEKDHQIGMICPISNNSANLTLDIFEGFGYTQMDSLLQRKFSGKNFDACTVTGNCLMLSRDCIEKVGYLDEAYGKGYGEETDYQFRAMAEGFKAKVAIDTYVLHESGVSFRNTDGNEEKIRKNRELFFLRWGHEYNKLLEKYEQNNPIKYIQGNLSGEDRKISTDTLFILPGLSQNAGGCHMIVDIVNMLVINGYNASLLYKINFDYREVLLFHPIKQEEGKEYDAKQLVATIWESAFWANTISEEKNIPVINLIQGYENYFENGSIYNSVELTHKISDYEITISNYLKDKLYKTFERESTLIANGVEYDLLSHKNTARRANRITFVLRGSPMKGDYILVDVIRNLDNHFKNLDIKVVYMWEFVEIPVLKNNKIVKIKGPLEKVEIAKILRETDIYVDASVNEGFGLLGLEAMTAGAVPISSNSFGVLEYLKDGYNGFIIKEINDPDKYIERIRQIIQDKGLFERLKSNGIKTSKDFDFDLTVKEYIKYFSQKREKKIKKFSKDELRIIESKQEREIIQLEQPYKNRFIYKLSAFIPGKLKNEIKKFVTLLYNVYDHP